MLWMLMIFRISVKVLIVLLMLLWKWCDPVACQVVGMGSLAEQLLDCSDFL